MDSAAIKRQILAESEKTGVRDRLLKQYEGGVGNDDILEMGNAFESLVQTKGWTYIEAYIIGRANPVALLFSTDDNPIEKGKAQGLISLMQHVDQVIAAKNKILIIENERRKAKDAAPGDENNTED